MWSAIGIAIYVIGFGGTLLFNLAVIPGPVTRPLIVLRNAVLWPFYLRMVIAGARRR